MSIPYHRFYTNLLFNARVPATGTEIVHGSFNLLKGTDSNPSESTWRLYKHPSVRCARSFAGSGKVSIRLETAQALQHFGGLFYDFESGNGHPWGFRVPSYGGPQWPPEKFYIPCSHLKLIYGWHRSGYLDANGQLVITKTRVEVNSDIISSAGAFTTSFSTIDYGPNWTPEEDGYTKFSASTTPVTDYNDGSAWYKVVGPDITASAINGGTAFNNFTGLLASCRDAEVDTTYTYKFNGPKDAYHPEKGTGSPYNFDKMTCSGRVVIELYIQCPTDTCWVEGTIYNVTVSYENFTCKIGNSRASSPTNDYEYSSTGSGEETFSYTMPNGVTNGEHEMGTFTWNLSPNQARKVTDVKLTSLTHA